MSVPMSPAEIESRVRALLVEVLSVAPDDVVPGARLMDDLNAESIDLLDLRFRIEKAFGLRMTNQDLVAAFGPTTTAAEFRQAFTVAALCAYLAHRIGPA